jgi:hypothetical protein
MTIFVRLLTLLTIAAAGFAMPLTCAQGSAASASDAPSIEIPAAQQLDHQTIDHLSAAFEQQSSSVPDRVLNGLPFDCGEAAPQVDDHSATFDTQPFVPGYLESTFQLDEDRPAEFALPPVLIPIESRAGPPDAPPPKSID